MTAKKRWCVRAWDDFCRSSGGLDISWSSSNSEDESCQPKKLKRFVSQTDIFCDSVNDIEEDSLVNCSGFTSHSKQDCSPTIGSLRLGETSPVLKYGESPVINSCRESPVLVRKFINMKNINTNTIAVPESKRTGVSCTNDEDLEISYSFLHDSDEDGLSKSPESSQVPTQPTVIIESNSSSQVVSQNSHYSIDPFSTQTSVIQNSPLQNNSTSPPLRKWDSPSSPEVKITESTESSSSKSSGFEILHREAKIKKNYRKGGLADQLEKALHRQKTDFAIWRHELYLKRNSPREDERFLLLKIRECWNECGATVVECEVLQKDGGERCLIVIGFNVTHALCLKVGARLKLYEPYMSKYVKYKDEVICYFNVSKIISCK